MRSCDAVAAAAARPQLGVHACRGAGPRASQSAARDAQPPLHGGPRRLARGTSTSAARAGHLARRPRRSSARDERQARAAAEALRTRVRTSRSRAVRRHARRRHVDARRRVVERGRRARAPSAPARPCGRGRRRGGRAACRVPEGSESAVSCGMVADAHGQDVRAVRARAARRVEGEARERAAVLAEVRAVQVDVGARADAFERRGTCPAGRVAPASKRVRYHAPRRGSGPQVWGTATGSPGVRRSRAAPRLPVRRSRGTASRSASADAARAGDAGRAAGRRPPAQAASAREQPDAAMAREPQRRALARERRQPRAAGRGQARTRSRSRRSVSSTSTISASVVLSSWSSTRWNWP